MQRKALGIVFLCLVLLVAIVLGYWDMLSSEKLRIAQTENLPASEEVAPPQDGASVLQPDPDRPSTSSAGETERVDVPATSSEQSASEQSATPDEVARIVPDPTGAAPRPDVSAKVEAADMTTAEKQPASPLESASSVPPTEDEASIGDRPLFDLLRVEPDGSTLIAGRSGPGSRVTLHAGKTVVGEDIANEAGEFVIVLPEPLAPGEHVISLTAMTPEGATTGSSETAIVSVPQPGRGDDVLAMVEAPDEASRLMTVPASPSRADGADGPDVGTTAAGRSATAISQDEAPTPAPAAGPEEPTDTNAGMPPELGAKDKAPEPAASPRLRIEAIEVEGEQIFVAGAADAGASVRIYLDNVLVAEDRATADNRFLVAAERPVAVGDHFVRADQVAVDGNVTARAEVPFTRPEGQAVAAIAPDPAIAPEKVRPSPDAAVADGSQAETRVAAASAPVGESVSAEARAAGPTGGAREMPGSSSQPDNEAGDSRQGDNATTTEAPATDLSPDAEAAAEPVKSKSEMAAASPTAEAGVAAPSNSTEASDTPASRPPDDGALPTVRNQPAEPARQGSDPTPSTDRTSVNRPVEMVEPRSPTGPKTPEIGQERTRAEASAAPDANAAVALDIPINRQAPLATATGRVIIRKGDTLWGISRDTYGRGSRYTVIYFANGNRIRDPDLIYPGQVFRLPPAQDEAREADAAEPGQGN